jgi:hypothetical protein
VFSLVLGKVYSPLYIESLYSSERSAKFAFREQNRVFESLGVQMALAVVLWLFFPKP